MTNIIDKIYKYSLEEIMGQRFGRYAKTIIQDRALPDARDGLKPVQRRILYSMYKDKNTHDKPYKKSAKTVGNVMGQLHPHGDSSIYDAMVRMSQWWKQNAVYIDMHGNNGSMDGDSPAAMRYTEARLSKIGEEMLRDIEKNVVEFAPNYDDTEMEPTVLPTKYPNLLVNGANGISAGYATNIPPHNLGEIIDATIYRIDNNESTMEDIMNIVKGPDFPTGGIVEGIKGIKEAFKTGRGKIILKSNATIVKDQIIVTEIPFEVNKANLVRKIDEIRVDKKIDGISEVRDETDKNGLRIVIDLKKSANKELVLNYLLKNTDLQISYNYNMVAIVNKSPKQLGIIKIIDAYINFQKEVITNRTKFDLEHAKARQHIVEGLIKALSILDEIIKIIRASKNKSDAKDNLIKEFQFTQIQAEAIVTLQLYKLSNTDVTLLEKELIDLNKLIKKLENILSSDKKLMNIIKDELNDIKEKYSTPRKTQIKEDITEIKIDTTLMIPKEDVIVLVTNDGYVKKVSKKSFSSSSNDTTGLKEGDYLIGLYEMNTMDTILLFTSLGNYLYVPIHDLPDAKWKDLGKHISNIVPIESNENIISSIPIYDFNQDGDITIFSKNGMIKRTMIKDFKVSRYSKPITCMKLKDDDELINATLTFNNKNVLIVTDDCYGLWYDIDSVPISGVKSAGVKSINLKNGSVVSGILFDDSKEYLLVFTNKGNAKRIKLSEMEMGKRAGRGLLIMKEVKSNPQKINSAYVVGKVNIDIKDNNGKFINLKSTEIPIMERYSTGSNVVKKGILSTHLEISLENKSDFESHKAQEEIINFDEEDNGVQISLANIDDKFLEVDEILDDFDL